MPVHSTVVFRGAITGQGYIAQATSSVYLDEISITTTGSQPAIRMVDIERVEALSGPQGTLYGSDAQAGTMRIVTNKPTMNAYEAIVDLEARGGDQSDPSYRGSLVFNVPLVDDKLALRVVGYSDRDGGYIDNVLGHTADTNLGRLGRTPPGFGTLDNSAVVEENWNDAETYRWSCHPALGYDGQLVVVVHCPDADHGCPVLTTTSIRLSAICKRPASMTSTAKTTTRCIRSCWTATWVSRSWSVRSTTTIETSRRSTTSRTTLTTGRHITIYARHWEPRPTIPITLPIPPAMPCYYPVYCQGATVDSDFFSSYYSPAQQDKFTTEIRLSSSGDTIDWLAGIYYEESNDSWQAPFRYPNNWRQRRHEYLPELGFTRLLGVVFLQLLRITGNLPGSDLALVLAEQHGLGAKRGLRRIHLAHERLLDLTLGGRYFKRTNTNHYIVDHPGDVGLNGEPDILDANSRQYRLANNNEPPPHHAEETEFIPKVALAYTTGNDNMVYGLFTRGKRRVVSTRARGVPFFPLSYDADLMDNYELGWRSNSPMAEAA